VCLELSRVFVVEEEKRDLEFEEADRRSLREYLFDQRIENNGI